MCAMVAWHVQNVKIYVKHQQNTTKRVGNMIDQIIADLVAMAATDAIGFAFNQARILIGIVGVVFTIAAWRSI